MRKWMCAVLLLLTGVLPAQALEWEFINSNNIARIGEVHASAVSTPVSFPPNAVHRKWAAVEAQQAVKRTWPEDQQKLIDYVEVRPSAIRENTVLCGAEFRLVPTQSVVTRR